MKQKIRLNESQLQKIIKESVKRILNEGPGSGYDVTIKGLKVKDIELKGGYENGEIVFNFKGEIKPSTVEWSAKDYYNYVSSDGIEYDGMIVMDYDDDDKVVNGGTITGSVSIENSNYEADIDKLKSDILYLLTDFDATSSFGGGYSHVNLPDTFKLTDNQISDSYLYIYIDTIKLDAPNIAKNINWFFENNHNFDEIFFGNNED